VTGDEVKVRRLERSDREGCLAVFDTVAEEFFSEDDRADFDAYLQAEPLYLVLLDAGGRIVGCGGVGRRGTDAVMTWGMVDGRLHGRGLGRRLAEERLRLVADLAGITRITLNTSQKTVGFYEHLGFRVVEHRRDGYRPGLDRFDLVKDLGGPGSSVDRHVLFDWRKWPDAAYRSTTMIRLGEDDHGTWLFAPRGRSRATPGERRRPCP
jgi:ribosomal protein S18 acetylase RimI-like enzyme